MKHSLPEEIELQRNRNVLLVLTGPTGSGKDTVLSELHKKNPSIVKIITTTSRKKRHEDFARDQYYFFDRSEFEQRIANHEFFEWVEFRGELYGTQKKTLEEALASGHDVIWRMDARGVKNIKEKVKAMVSRVVFVFLDAPISTLEERVKHDEGSGFMHRWNEPLVKWELEQYDDCDYLVINEQEKLEETVMKVRSIMDAKRLEIDK
jgi:guanylate kinase